MEKSHSEVEKLQLELTLHSETPLEVVRTRGGDGCLLAQLLQKQMQIEANLGTVPRGTSVPRGLAVQESTLSLRPVQLTGGCRPGTEDWQFSLLGVAARVLLLVLLEYDLRCPTGPFTKPLRLQLRYRSWRMGTSTTKNAFRVRVL